MTGCFLTVYFLKGMRFFFCRFPFLLLQGGVSSRQSMNTATTFDKQGHRGCRGLLPENTIPAMKKALDLGVTTLEMDAVITNDGEVILSHEPFFNHEITTKPDGSFVGKDEEKSLNIYAMTYEQVRRFDVGIKPHPRFPKQEKMAAVKPRLIDVIDSLKQYCTEKRVPFPQWNIETKSQPPTDNLYHPAPDVFAQTLMDVVLKAGITAQTIIQSFDFRTLQYLHQHYPTVKTAMLIEDYDKRTLDEQLQALGFVPTICSPHFLLVTEELVKRCHQKGMKIIPWTVNERDEMEELIALGVDGIITDYLDLFAQVTLY
jgi:glycerophosphoryl diester phosphodiesterase